MKKIITLLSFVLLISCIEEDESYTYYKYFRVKNTSDKLFRIVIRDIESSYKYLDRELKPNESTDYYQQSSLSNDFSGFSYFIGSTLTILFNDNGTGYVCRDYPDNSGLCFTTKGAPFGNANESDFILDKKERENVKYYTFEITAADYENAHVLPAVER